MPVNFIGSFIRYNMKIIVLLMFISVVLSAQDVINSEINKSDTLSQISDQATGDSTLSINSKKESSSEESMQHIIVDANYFVVDQNKYSLNAGIQSFLGKSNFSIYFPLISIATISEKSNMAKVKVSMTSLINMSGMIFFAMMVPDNAKLSPPEKAFVVSVVLVTILPNAKIAYQIIPGKLSLFSGFNTDYYLFSDGGKVQMDGVIGLNLFGLKLGINKPIVKGYLENYKVNFSAGYQLDFTELFDL